MGSGGTKYVTERVTEIVYKTDECRAGLRELAMEYMTDASRTYDDCTKNATQSAWKDLRHNISKETKRALVNESKKIRNRLRADRKFCYNIEKKYKPFGIQAPVNLQCDKSDETSKRCEKNPDDYDDTCESGKLPTESQSPGSKFYQYFKFLI